MSYLQLVGEILTKERFEIEPVPKVGKNRSLVTPDIIFGNTEQFPHIFTMQSEARWQPFQDRH